MRLFLKKVFFGPYWMHMQVIRPKIVKLFKKFCSQTNGYFVMFLH